MGEKGGKSVYEKGGGTRQRKSEDEKTAEKKGEKGKKKEGSGERNGKRNWREGKRVVLSSISTEKA